MLSTSTGKALSIVHVTHQYPPEEMGGVEVYTRNVATEQARLGHSVTVIVPGKASAGSKVVPTYEDGVTVIRVPQGTRGRARVFAATWSDSAFLEAFQEYAQAADLVHIQHLMGIPTAMTAFLNKAVIPYVITLHDYWFPCANAQLVTNYDNTVCDGPDNNWHNCGRCMASRANLPDLPLLAYGFYPIMRNRFQKLKRAFDGAARVIAVSKFVKDTYAGLGFDGGHVAVLASGIDLQREQMERVTQEASNGAAFHVVYLGSIAELKGVHVLVEAFNLMPEDVQLTVAGGLEKFATYSAELSTAATHANINFIGQISRQEVWELLESADIVILPSLWYEASPLTIGEFFSSAVPIIASDIGAISEHIRHGVDGLLFPPGDAPALYHAMKQLYDDRDLLKTLAGNAPSVSTVADHTEKLQAIYADVIQKSTDDSASNINLPST